MNSLKIKHIAAVIVTAAITTAAIIGYSKWQHPDISQRMSLTVLEQRYLETHPITKIGVVQDNAPSMFISEGKADGFSIDYMNEVAAISGLNFQITLRGNATQLIEEIKVCNIDALPGWRATGERTGPMGFTAPFVAVRTVLIMRPGKSELSSHPRIGAGKAYAVIDFIEQHPNYKTVEYENNSAALYGLLKRDVEAVALPLPSAVYEINAAHAEQTTQLVAVPFIHYYSFGVCKNDAILTDMINKAIAKIPDSTKQKIASKWSL
jgi:ABC-type amino acid transport substrate-binding protein